LKSKILWNPWLWMVYHKIQWSSRNSLRNLNTVYANIVCKIDYFLHLNRLCSVWLQKSHKHLWIYTSIDWKLRFERGLLKLFNYIHLECLVILGHTLYGKLPVLDTTQFIIIYNIDDQMTFWPYYAYGYKLGRISDQW
jgi:hypothetical protein